MANKIGMLSPRFLTQIVHTHYIDMRNNLKRSSIMRRDILNFAMRTKAREIVDGILYQNNIKGVYTASEMDEINSYLMTALLIKDIDEFFNIYTELYDVLSLEYIDNTGLTPQEKLFQQYLVDNLNMRPNPKDIKALGVQHIQDKVFFLKSVSYGDYSAKERPCVLAFVDMYNELVDKHVYVDYEVGSIEFNVEAIQRDILKIFGEDDLSEFDNNFVGAFEIDVAGRSKLWVKEYDLIESLDEFLTLNKRIMKYNEAAFSTRTKPYTVDRYISKLIGFLV